MFQTHKPLYFVLAIIGAAAMAAGLLLAIQNFKTGEEIAATSNSPSSRYGEGQGEVDQGLATWHTYRNEKYGFEFKYPNSRTPYNSTDAQKELLIPADSDDGFVAISEDEKMLLCCEAITLSFRIITTESTDAWLSQGIDKYMSALDNVIKTNVVFKGRPAVMVMGAGHLGSIWKAYAFGLNKQELLLIEQNAQSGFLDRILSTFKFIELK